eukprot:363937-Chlamydomonas_euryale.AAC.2
MVDGEAAASAVTMDGLCLGEGHAERGPIAGATAMTDEVRAANSPFASSAKSSGVCFCDGQAECAPTTGTESAVVTVRTLL